MYAAPAEARTAAHELRKQSPSVADPPDIESCAPLLVGAESYEWAAISNLDVFFARVYRYWNGRGLLAIIVSGVLNIAVLAFTISFSGFLLIFVNWSALRESCVQQDSCDITSVALYSHPFGNRGVAVDVMIFIYIFIFGMYWFWSLCHFAWELKGMAEVKYFVNNKLGISERQVGMMTWAEVVHKIVLVQRSTRLSIARDLNEHDIVSRIMRKDNYLIALVNAGLLRTTWPWQMLRRSTECSSSCSGGGGEGHGSSCKSSSKQQLLMTKTLEWNLRWCILDPMFDETFCLKRAMFADVEKLKQRLRSAAIVNAILSPFLLLFLIIYFFMHNAERFYSHPGSISSRRWSPLAEWMFREYNELPHYIENRLNASHEAATKYIAQFPSHTVASVARFVAFVTGSFTALLLLITILDEKLLERDLFGRHIVWWLATMGVLLTASRALVSEEPVAYDPEAAMYEVVKHSHYLPRRWRGRAHTAEVQSAFNSLFKPKVVLFLEEMASVVLTPFMLGFSLPACAEEIAEFLRETSVHVEGVGDVCSLSTLDLERHGNSKYGSPGPAPSRGPGHGKPGGGGGGRGHHGATFSASVQPLLGHDIVFDRQGKLEKSLLTFVATYPTWVPPPAGRLMLKSLSRQAARPHHFFNLGGCNPAYDNLMPKVVPDWLRDPSAVGDGPNMDDDIAWASKGQAAVMGGNRAGASGRYPNQYLTGTSPSVKASLQHYSHRVVSYHDMASSSGMYPLADSTCPPVDPQVNQLEVPQHQLQHWQQAHTQSFSHNVHASNNYLAGQVSYGAYPMRTQSGFNEPAVTQSIELVVTGDSIHIEKAGMSGQTPFQSEEHGLKLPCLQDLPGRGGYGQGGPELSHGQPINGGGHSATKEEDELDFAFSPPENHQSYVQLAAEQLHLLGEDANSHFQPTSSSLGDSDPSVATSAAPRQWGSQSAQTRTSGAEWASGMSSSYAGLGEEDRDNSSPHIPVGHAAASHPLSTQAVPAPQGHNRNTRFYHAHSQGPDTQHGLRPPPPCIHQSDSRVHQPAACSSLDASNSTETIEDIRRSVFGLGQPPFNGPPAFDTLPRNETIDLQHRLISGHGLLQSLYEEREESVRHRRLQAAVERSISHSRMGRKH